MRRLFGRPGIATGLVVSAVILSAGVVAHSPVEAFAAGAPGAAVPVVQAQTGLAFGTAAVNVYLDPNRRVSSGTYASTGQLGRGQYSFDLSTGPSLCGHGDFTMSITGTAALTRSDGAKVTGTVTGSERCDQNPTSVTLDLALTHGRRDLIGAQLQFTGTLEMHITPGGDVGTESYSFRGTSSATTRIGYAMVDRSGKTYAFGGVDHLGDAPVSPPAADLTLTPSGRGYWVADDSGHVYAFGDARYLGGNDPSSAANGVNVTSMSATPTGKGYWLFLADGHVLPFGDAKSFGDLAATVLNRPIVGSVATPTGKGYYMVAGDGGVFAFGDARFRGSMGGTHLNRPVVGIVPTADNTGYWLVAADGGVFSFNAPFRGSMGAVTLNRPIVTMVPYAGSYLMVASDGGVFNFSDGPFFGSTGGGPIPAPIVSGAATG